MMNTSTPSHLPPGDAPDLEYVGFWLRVWASLIDSVLIFLLLIGVVSVLYGRTYWTSTSVAVEGPVNLLLGYGMPALVVLLFWLARQATPGKMAIRARIVDATTGGKPGTFQLVLRYVGYFISTIPFGLGLLWVGFDARKQGWHDKIAGTVVVRPRGGTQRVHFDKAQ